MANRTPLYRNPHAWRAFAAGAAGTLAGLRASHNGVPAHEAVETGKQAALLAWGFGYGVANKLGDALAKMPGATKQDDDIGEKAAVGIAAAVTVTEMAAPHILGDPVNGGFLTLGAGLGLATRRALRGAPKK